MGIDSTEDVDTSELPANNKTPQAAIKSDNQEGMGIPVTISAEPGAVIIRVGPVAVSLPSPVFEHLAEKGKMYVYLSDYDNYVMEPWLEGTVNSADLWSAKGIADYILETNQEKEKGDRTFEQAR
jgi:hypothetical protein